ncbi:MAG: hypothetical protein HKN72_15650 [Gemmatimonadetes bacterium]|nr:hypothetical protein [Gemmatimonadota bacterium]
MLKVDRAHGHLRSLRGELSTYFSRQPFEVAVKRDPETRKPIYFVSKAEPVPDRLAVVAGDVIQNLVTALDHLAYQLVCVSTNDAPPNPHRVYFPIARDADTYEKGKRRKLDGASDAAIAAVDELEPYQGGNDTLWTMQQLNNVEKHRLLVTVGAQAGGVNLGQLGAHLVESTFPPEAVEALKSMSLYIQPVDKGFPLEPGFELLLGAPDEPPNPDQQFRFDVALHEPGIADGRPLIPLLEDFAKTVQLVVDRLSPLLESQA